MMLPENIFEMVRIEIKENVGRKNLQLFQKLAVKNFTKNLTVPFVA